MRLGQREWRQHGGRVGRRSRQRQQVQEEEKGARGGGSGQGCSGWGSTAACSAVHVATRARRGAHTPINPAVLQKKRKGGGAAAAGGGAQPPVDPEARKEGERRFQVGANISLIIELKHEM